MVKPVNLPARVMDGLANVFSRLGTLADRNTQSTYWVPPLSQDMIENAYRSSWMARKIHDLPPFEMTRAGRNWQADKNDISKLETVERDLQIWAKLRKGLTTARLHGGAALVLGVRQGMPDKPLVTQRITKGMLRYAVVFSRHQLAIPEGFELDPESEFFMQPKMYEMRAPRGNPIKIHPSRVIPLHGQPLPEGGLTMSQQDQFWGDPLLVSVKSAIDNAETSQAAVSTLLHEMKQDVISIPGLTRMFATKDGERLLEARLQGHEAFKSMFNAILLDSGNKDGKGGEKWETRQLSFAQHPELLRAFCSIVGGASDIPVTRLMGESPGGLNSTGKGEQEDFNRSISGRQDVDLAPALARLDEILIPSSLGTRPEEITSEFAPLDEISATAASENEKRDAETAQIYHNIGALPGGALQEATQNRMLESDRWPGLEAALEKAREALEIEPGPDGDEGELPDEQDVLEAERRGTITRDDAVRLLTDASPRTLYVQRKLLNGKEFLAWAAEQGFGETLTADDLHVTIALSRRPVDWMDVGEEWSMGDDGKLTVEPGGARIVEPLGTKGAVVLLFSSSHLSYRHERVMREANGSYDFPNYQPHVTITYAAPEGLDLAEVEPYRGALEFGPEIFEEVDDDWRPPVAGS